MKRKIAWLIMAILPAVVILGCAGAIHAQGSGSKSKEEVARIAPEEAYKNVKSGSAILVCAYANEEKCKKMQLKGSIQLEELEDKLPKLSKDQELIFYCA